MISASLTALSETGLQYLLGGLGHLSGASSVASKIGQYLGEFGKYTATTALGQSVISLMGMMAARVPSEGLEEFTQKLLEPVIQYFATGEWNWADDQVRMALYEGGLGMINSLLIGATTDVYQTAVGVYNLTNIGNEVKNTSGGVEKLLNTAKASPVNYVSNFANALEKRIANGTAKAADIGELYSRVTDLAIAAEVQKINTTSDVFKNNVGKSAEYYQAIADGKIAEAERMLRSVADDLINTVETIGNTMKTDNNKFTLKQTGNTVNNTAKAEPTAGEAGAQALSDIAKTNPGLAEEGVGHTDLVDAYNAGVKGEDIARGTRDNAAAGNYTQDVEAMYNAGLEDAKTRSTSAEGSRGVNSAAETVVTGAAETQSGLSTEQTGTTSTKQSNVEVNPELEEKLEPFEYTAEQRAVAEKYAETGDANVIPNNYEKTTVQKIIQGAEVIKKFNAENGIDSKQDKEYDNNENLEYYNNLVEKARIVDVSTSENQAVFYSGDGNRALAEAFAELNGKKTLEMTTGGKYFDELKLFESGSLLTKEQARSIWRILSERYAKGASGNTYGFVRGAYSGSIFNTVEYLELEHNVNVNNIFTEFM